VVVPGHGTMVRKVLAEKVGFKVEVENVSRDGREW